MARAVATLEGDSSSLVDAIDKAKGSMTKLESEGKKLTDQLRDVADEADKAAGALVNKIGGPGAIKAIAGVGAAFVAAESALGAFSASMSAYASTQGAAGQQAMADLDKAVNELQGQLFTAVMGTDDMATAMDTVVTVVKAATVVVQALLFPLTALSTGIRDFATESDGATKKQRELMTAEREHAKAVDALSTSVVTLNQKYKDIEGSLIQLLGTKKEAALFDLQTSTDKYLAYVQEAEALQFTRELIAGNRAADRAEADQRLVNLARDGEETRQVMELTEMGLAADAQALAQKFIKEREVALDNARDSARQKEIARVREENKGMDEQKNRAVAGLQEMEKRRQDILSGRKVIPENTPTGGGAPAGGEGDRAALIASLDEEAKIRADALIAQLEAERQLVLQYGDPRKNLTDSAAVVEAQANKDRLDAKQADALVRLKETEAAEKARIQATAEFEKQFDDAKKARDDAKAAEEKAAHDEKVNQLTAGFQEYGKLAGQQLADGEKASKVAEKLAKKALGAQISALGDKAMVEAAIYAAAFNPMAIPMAAAGVAAYTAAAYLGAEGKKATTATPAAAAPAAAPVNTAFNLRVDAAFADGESIARQFAMMQRSAQRRGLVPAGA